MVVQGQIPGKRWNSKAMIAKQKLGDGDWDAENLFKGFTWIWSDLAGEKTLVSGLWRGQNQAVPEKNLL